MSHRPTQRRNLAASESNPSSTISAKAKCSKPATTPFHHPDLKTQASKPSFMVKQFTSLNLGHSSLAPHKQSQTKHHPLVDTPLQPKAMTTSAIFDSSKFSLKPSTTRNTRLPPKLEKESTKRNSKEKPLKSFTEVERRKLQGLVSGEKKDSNRRSMVEDVQIEKSRNSRVEEHDVKRTSVSLGGGRRRSLCGSQVELGDFFAINGVKMVSADMPPFMQIHAVDCARKAFDSMEKFTSKTLAFSLKKEFDGVYGPAWHCIVGTSFGSFVTHSAGGFLYFSMDQKLYILLFKTAVQKVN